MATIDEMLKGSGYTSDVLTDPGSLYDFGASYNQFFRPFDISKYNTAIQETDTLEDRLQGNINKMFSSKFTSGQQGSIDASSKVMGGAAKSGMLGGANDRMLENLRRLSSSKFEDTVRARDASNVNLSESMGARRGAIEGTVTDYITQVENRALQIQSFDPTGGSESRIVNQKDIDTFSKSLSGSSRDGFLTESLGYIGGNYQSLVDLYQKYKQENQQGTG